MNEHLTHEFHKFLDSQGIKPGGCVLFQSSDGRYYVCTCAKTSNSTLYVINDNFWYDYPEIWRESSPWNVIFKKTE